MFAGSISGPFGSVVIPGASANKAAADLRLILTEYARLQSESAKDGEARADLDRLEALAKAATPGPWDHMKGRNLVRAIRDDLAVPLFEAQEPYCDPLLGAPTCRVGSKVVFRANSEAARQSAAMKQEHHNAAYIAALNPAVVLAILALARKATPPAGSTQIGEG